MSKTIADNDDVYELILISFLVLLLVNNAGETSQSQDALAIQYLLRTIAGILIHS